MAAVTQISHRHSDGRAYYERKLAEGKTPKEALRSLKRRVSDAIFARLGADADRACGKAHAEGAREGMGNDSVASAAGSHPHHRLFGQATPGPATTLRPGQRRWTPKAPLETRQTLLTQRGFVMALSHVVRLCVESAPELVFCAPGPRPFMAAFSPLLAEPLHFIMQTRQFHNLRTKVGAGVNSDVAAAASPAVVNGGTAGG